MKNKKIIIITLLLIFALTISVGCNPENSDDKDHADAKSGVYAIYEINVEKLTQEQRANLDAYAESAKECLEAYFINKGFTNAQATVENRSIRIEIKNQNYPEYVFKVEGRLPYAEFKEYVDGKGGDLSLNDPNGKVKLDTKITGADVINAEVVVNEYGSGAGLGAYAVSIAFTQEGREKISTSTSALLGERISIWLDYKLIRTPYVNEEVSSDTTLLSGFYAYDHAYEVVVGLRLSAYYHALNLTEYDVLKD